MKTLNFFGISLITVCLLSAILVLISCSRYGIGVSPDSVDYISTARNILNGQGMRIYNGEYYVYQPPLYPGLLAITALILKSDPLNVATYLNVVFAGLILFISGLYFKSFFSDQKKIYYFFGVLIVAISKPMVDIFAIAWTELPFILFLVLFLISVFKYLKVSNVLTLFYISITAGLAFLTRYIGMAVILTGIVGILFLSKQILKKKIFHLGVFLTLSTLPIAFWLIRNWKVTGTFVGERYPSFYSFQEIGYDFFNTIISWYLPDSIAQHRIGLALFAVVIGLVVGLSVKTLSDFMNEFRVYLSNYIIPSLIFIGFYIGSILFSSRSIAMDRIDTRLLSPLSIPLTLLLLIFLDIISRGFGNKFNLKSANRMGSIVLIMLIFMLCISTINITESRIKIGAGGYNNSLWHDSDIVQALEKSEIDSIYPLYSNLPDALYFFSGLAAKTIPEKYPYQSNEVLKNIDDLVDTWPPEDHAYLIWFENWSPSYKFSIQELFMAIPMEKIRQFDDGAIYKITKS